MRLLLLSVLVLLLAGCDKLTGEADRKMADAEAVGFACRVSSKSPEDCMKENDSHSPSYILDGWKFADEDIKSGKLDPSMRNMAAAKHSADAAAESEPESEDQPVEAAPADAGS